MEKAISSNNYCNFCKEREAISTFEIYNNWRVTNYIVVAATITKEYLLVPACEICLEELERAKLHRILNGIPSIIFAIFAFALIFSIIAGIKNNQSIFYELTLSAFVFPLFLFFIYRFNKNHSKYISFISKLESPQKQNQIEQIFDKFQIDVKSILWIEKELLKLNQEMFSEDRPQRDSNFFQHFPKVLLTKEKLSTSDIAEAITELVKQTEKRIGKLEVPFRKPRVIFTLNLPENEPGHIEFGEYETIIRIHPDFLENPFALASILCHELAHFILDQNGLRKENKFDNEKLTDLFIFKCGQGLIYLQGILDVTSENEITTENRLGYLSLEEVAYAHVRCSSQHGLSIPDILPKYLTTKIFTEVKRGVEFLTLKNSSLQLAEIILCPNNHVLRISIKRSQKIRCPKCKWEKEIWMHKNDHLNFLIEKGIRNFDCGNFNEALQDFRDAQKIDRMYSMAYCWASRSLKKLGKRQDAIRELQKLLSICPEDVTAQNEMKNLIYE